MADDTSTPAAATSTEDRPLPTLLDMTPLNETFRLNPHAVLDDLRARCPVHDDPMSGNLVVSRYDDVSGIVKNLELLRDPLKATRGNLLRQRAEIPEGTPISHVHSILTLDDPDHGRVRPPLAQALYARAARFKPEVERIVAEALDRLEAAFDAAGEGGSADLMETVCVPIPIDVIASIIGVEHERLAEFRQWSEDAIEGLNPFRSAEATERMEASSLKLGDYFTALIEARRAKPRDDLVSDMTRLQAEGLAVDDIELRINITALLIGGNLTTTDLIGNAVRQLLTNPGELAKLKADPKLINALVEEALRIEGPVDITGRVAPEDMEIGGCPVAKGQAVTVSLRAANHDPAAYPEPHKFDITRAKKSHLSFGGGAHICIGAPLARLEAQVAIARLFERFPDLKLADPSAVPAWRKLPFFRGLETLEVVKR